MNFGAREIPLRGDYALPISLLAPVDWPMPFCYSPVTDSASFLAKLMLGVASEGGDQMFAKKLVGISALAETIAVSQWAQVPTARTLPRVIGKAAYAPRQSVSNEFGAKPTCG